MLVKRCGACTQDLSVKEFERDITDVNIFKKKCRQCMKKRDPQDITLRNNKARIKEIQKLKKEIKQIKEVQSQIWKYLQNYLIGDKK